MATLPDLDRAAIRHEVAELWSSELKSISINKTDLRAAVNALDDYMHANAAAINNALPAAAKAGLTTSQKAWLLAAVVLRRYGGGV